MNTLMNTIAAIGWTLQVIIVAELVYYCFPWLF